MSMYAAYVKERLGDECIETEHGFVSYRYLPDGAVYIVDLYILPEFRRSNKAGALADLVVTHGLRVGCKKLMGTVGTHAKNSTESVAVLIAYGMKLVSSNNEYLVFEKDI